MSADDPEFQRGEAEAAAWAKGRSLDALYVVLRASLIDATMGPYDYGVSRALYSAVRLHRDKPLNDIMEIDHVIEVHPDGTITEPKGVYAPNLFDDDLDDKTWTLLDGYSSQDRYSGPLMHNCESIGNRMEDDIRSTPGVYVAIVAYWPPDEDDDEDAELYAEGWAVARKNPPNRWCVYPGDNHSDDNIEYWHGRETPTHLCGYHASWDLTQVLATIRDHGPRVLTS